MIGLDEPDLLTVIPVGLDSTPTIASTTGTPWDTILKRGDKIVDSVFGSMAISEIVEMPDFGGDVMAYRLRVE